MLFTRTYSCKSPHTIEALKTRLVGDNIRIHNLDFEAIEEEDSIRFVPDTDNVAGIKTLPITYVQLQATDGTTNVVITSRMRPLDLGGPQLVIILCFLLVVVCLILYFVLPPTWGDRLAAYISGGVGLLIFILFCIRMNGGYFDYVRKVREHVVALVK